MPSVGNKISTEDEPSIWVDARWTTGDARAGVWPAFRAFGGPCSEAHAFADELLLQHAVT